jgi:hypothetical protein
MKRQDGDTGSKPAGDKPDPSAAKPSGSGEAGTKPGDTSGNPKGQPPKPGPAAQPSPGDSSAKPGQPTEPKGEPGQPADAPPSTDPPKSNARRDGTGVPNPNAQGTADPSAPPTRTENGTAPDAEHAKKAGDLQLEKFPKNPSKEMLQDLGMTEEQYRQFLKDAAELQKKRQAEAKNNRERGSGTGGSAANTGAKRVETNGEKKGPLERGGATLPPPEYRDGYKGYTEDVSKPAGGGKKEP